MQYNFAAGFVVYNPSPEFLSRLKLLNKLGCGIYLYDNSPEQSATRTFVKKMESASYLTAGKNLGLGIGISSICAQAYYDSFTTLLFFDQDTIFDEGTLCFIQEFIDRKMTEIQDEYTAIVFGAKSHDQIAEREKFTITNVTLSISSGSLFLLNNLKKIGWHNNKYFVDGVDYEICLKSLANNQKIGECRNAPGFDHFSEQPDKIYSIFGSQISLRRYSLTRIIDITKSSGKLVMSSLFFGQPKFALSIVRSYAISVAAQVLARVISK